MSPELIDFCNIVFRYVHVIAAIMWIGNSLLFTWMEIKFIKRPDEPDMLGYIDMLHAGGVYHLEKRVLKPGAIPKPLYWFYWQSYTTWLTGFGLLVTYFYTRAETLLLDPAKTDMSGWGAIAISFAGIIGGWLLYDAYWRSPLQKYLWAGAAFWLAVIIGYAAFLDTVFNGRLVYLQVGMTLATFMTANVFVHIIPNQRKMMKALEAGKDHNLKVGKAAKFRSHSNHYITFPVVFFMLSGHAPTLYGAERNVLILSIIMIALMLAKYFMNAPWAGKKIFAAIIANFVITSGLVIAAISIPTDSGPSMSAEAIAGEAVFKQLGCVACHQGANTSIAPNLQGIYGTERALTDGSSVIADDAYLLESILQSNAKVTAGYAPAMPVYSSVITEEQAEQLLAYLKEY